MVPLARPGVGVFHTGYKLVTHAHVEGLVGAGDAVEARCGVPQGLVVQREEGELVPFVGAVLQAVGERCAERHTPEVASAVHAAAVQLDVCGCGAMAHLALQEEGHQSGPRYRDVCPILIGVEQRAVRGHVGTRLPFIRTPQFQSQRLGSTEGIVLFHAEGNAWSHLSVALAREPGLEFSVVWFGQHRLYVQVECVAGER